MIDDPGARLRGAGLRVTHRRLALIEAVRTLGGHPTADEVAGALVRAGVPMPRASLYHALGAMADAGVLLVADAGPGVARYEVATAWHHHLVCRTCRVIVDVPCVRGASPCLDADLAGAIIDEAQVIFRGLCPACARQRDPGIVAATVGSA